MVSKATPDQSSRSLFHLSCEAIKHKRRYFNLFYLWTTAELSSRVLLLLLSKLWMDTPVVHTVFVTVLQGERTLASLRKCLVFFNWQIPLEECHADVDPCFDVPNLLMHKKNTSCPLKKCALLWHFLKGNDRITQDVHCKILPLNKQNGNILSQGSWRQTVETSVTPSCSDDLWP